VALRVDGTERLALPREEVWRRINDPQVLGACIPGCEGLEAADDGRYRTAITVVVGAVKGTYRGTVHYRDVQAPERCTVVVEGRGQQGSIAGQGAIRLGEAGESTDVTYSGEFRLGGRVAGVGQRAAPAVSRRIIVETLHNIAATPPGR
jgi:carbon monoxide dehydrogenase subunit G